MLDYGKSKFNNSLTVKRQSENQLEAIIENIEDSMMIYLTVVFKDNVGAIVNGPIYSKYEIEGKIFYLCK